MSTFTCPNMHSHTDMQIGNQQGLNVMPKDTVVEFELTTFKLPNDFISNNYYDLLLCK